MPDPLRARITARLSTRGWTPLPLVALASKDYDTAVGPKTAHAHLADFGAATANLVLQGDYWSEGRNILGAGGVLVPREGGGGRRAGRPGRRVLPQR